MTAPRQCILNFHGIGTPHDGVLPDEVPYWLSAARFAEVADRVRDRRANGQDIRLTFDDGNLSDLEIAAPVLAERGLAAEFFVLTGRLDQAHYLSREGVHSLLEIGMRIGLHGRDHVDWRRAGPEELDHEVSVARARLEDILGRKVDNVGIPFGAYGRREIAYLKGQGFGTIYTSDGGHVSSTARVKARTSLRSDMSLDDIDDILAAREPVHAQARRAVSVFLRRHVR